MPRKYDSYSTTPGSNNSAPPDGAPEGWAPSAVNAVVRENMARAREWYEEASWIDLGHALTYSSATVFLVNSTDVTAFYPTWQRIKIVGTPSPGTIYGTVVSSSFATNTTVTVVWDSASSAGIQSGDTYTIETQPGTGDEWVPLPNDVQHLTSVSGTNTITAVGVFGVAAYVTGQRFTFVTAGANTGAVTLNINGLGAKSLTRDGTVALVSGDLPSGALVTATYDGTRFQMAGTHALSAFGRTLIDDADAAAARTTLGVDATNLIAPATTRMVFQQTAAPTGWTKETGATYNDVALRVTTGTVASNTTGDTFSSVFGTGKSTAAFTLLDTHLPVTTIRNPSLVDTVISADSVTTNVARDANTTFGGGTGHSHNLNNLNLEYYDVIIAAKD
jgi:hypothetical protein